MFFGVEVVVHFGTWVVLIDVICQMDRYSSVRFVFRGIPRRVRDKDGDGG